ECQPRRSRRTYPKPQWRTSGSPRVNRAGGHGPQASAATGEEDAMEYVVLIYESAKDFASRGSGPSHPYIAAWRAYYKALVAAGVYVGGEALQDAGTATTVRLREGRPQVQDGPFAEAKEQLGGFIPLDLPSLYPA